MRLDRTEIIIKLYGRKPTTTELEKLRDLFPNEGIYPIEHWTQKRIIKRKIKPPKEV